VKITLYGFAFLAIVASFGAANVAAFSDQVVSVLHAGSLTPVFQTRLVPELAKRGITVYAEGRGSVANGSMIRAGLKNPDLFISADDDVMERLLIGPDAPIRWYANFATSHLVIAYAPNSPFAERFREAAAGRARWYDVLSAPGIKIGRTDPAVDPKGYRTIIALELAEGYYHEALRARILGDDRNPAQTFTDEAILTRLDEGELDAAFLYSHEAMIRKLPIIELPPEINLGDAHFAARYRRASVTINGLEHVGEPIVFALSIPTAAANSQGAADILRFLIDGDGKKALTASGLQVTPLAFHGDLHAVPAELRPK
jgi:molybdate/tungstate transport system substrate-binding protein